ncbi:MAG: LacI family DNA-binding transcriptional regulator [Anaerolineales bacterium]|nr:LacI family DNA-binding transcriptional regulator [Anaerolineales bacterium]
MSDLTLDDIAAKAGVSRATVSRVVNGHPSVSSKTRQKVQKIIQETGFQPNLVARSLASRKTSIIGLVIPRSVHGFFVDPYFPRLVEGISAACNQYDYTLSLLLFHTEEDERKLFPRVTQKGFLDGIIVQATGLGDRFYPKVSDWTIPFIFAGRPMIPDKVSYLDVDNHAGAYSAVIHLAQNGYRRIATITGALNTAAGADRLSGFQRAIQERGLEFDEKLIVEGDFTETSGYYAAKQLLPHKPEAIFVSSDAMALGAIRFFQETGLVIPNDVAIVGFDDLPPATLSRPQLTTVRQPVRSFGFKAVETLIDIIENGSQPPRRIIFDTELVIRDSCGTY